MCAQLIEVVENIHAYRAHEPDRPTGLGEHDALPRSRVRYVFPISSETVNMASHVNGQPIVEPLDGARHWTPHHVALATGGRWAQRPPADWQATGLCIWRPSMQSGDMVAVRGDGDRRGVPVNALPRLQHQPTAFITTDSSLVPQTDTPTLIVDDISTAILRLGGYSRNRMVGRLVAVTGSAGKTTTVAMLAHVLAVFGSVAQTRHNANLPYGVAWNLASISWDTTNTAVELAIGSMDQNSRLARPDVAVVTNILPAHLEYHHDMKTIARRKSRIFEGMSPGGYAIINREMNEVDILILAARKAGLNILYFGRSQDCAFRLLDYGAADGYVQTRCSGIPVQYRLQAAGEHMALNGLATLAAVAALGYDVNVAAKALEGFEPLPGRGLALDVEVDGRRITVIDDAYNANPGSMETSIIQVGNGYKGRRKLIGLGEMLELGKGAETYHTQLAQTVTESGVDRVYAMGSLYSGFWAELPESMRGAFVSNCIEFKTVLFDHLRDGDVLLLKGSHGSELHTLVDWLKEGGPRLGKHIGALSYDVNSARIMYVQNGSRRYRPMSLTKLLALCLIDERISAINCDRSEKITISETAADVNSWWGFDVGDRVGIRDLMTAAMTVSANEAINALAEWHSGSSSSFTEELNRRAGDLGLRDTRFSAPDGWGRDQWITVKDALTLTCFVRDLHPAVAALARTPRFSWKKKSQDNTNRLLRTIPGVDGLKTGTLIDKSNSCFNLILSAAGPNPRISIVLGARSKAERDDAAAWLNVLPD